MSCKELFGAKVRWINGHEVWYGSAQGDFCEKESGEGGGLLKKREGVRGRAQRLPRRGRAKRAPVYL